MFPEVPGDRSSLIQRLGGWTVNWGAPNLGPDEMTVVMFSGLKNCSL